MMPRTTAALVLCLAAAPACADGQGEAKASLNANGTTALTYSTPPTDFGTVFGLDLSKAASSAAPASGASAGELGGTAYAKVSLNQLPGWMLWQTSTVNLSIDPSDARSKVATTFSRTVTLVGGLDATLADAYQVASGSEAWETAKSVSLRLVDTGTTLSLTGKATQDAPRALLPTLSAQQKVFGDLAVTTSVADTGATLNKSITAGFTHRW